jgi:hypothetical protein
MPRYFGNETYNGDQGAVKWYNGACAVAEDDTAAIAYLDAITGIDKDTNKHELTALDKLPRDVLDDVASYLGVTLTPGEDKYAVVRNIETSISTKYITAVTATSAAHDTEVGQTTVTITGAAGEGNAYYYKTAKDTAPAPLYGDKADSTWTVCTSPFSFEPTATHNKITVVKAVVATGFILARGSDDITTKDS